MRARRTDETAFHAGSAASAERTAASTSVASASGTRRITSPVEGLVTLPRRALCAVVRTPPIQNGTSVTRVVDSGRVALVGTMASTPDSRRGLRHDACKATRHHVQRLVELLVGDDQRRKKTDPIAKGARGNEQDAALTRGTDDPLRLFLGRFLRRAIANEFDGNHRATAAHVADEREPACPLPGARFNSDAGFLGSGQQMA